MSPSLMVWDSRVLRAEPMPLCWSSLLFHFVSCDVIFFLFHRMVHGVSHWLGIWVFLHKLTMFMHSTRIFCTDVSLELTVHTRTDVSWQLTVHTLHWNVISSPALRVGVRSGTAAAGTWASPSWQWTACHSPHRTPVTDSVTYREQSSDSV